MSKGYWICCYRSVSNPAALTEYAAAAGPAIKDAGGRFLTRGIPAKAYEAGKNERTVVIEFDSVEQAIAAYESEAYKTALKRLSGSAERDVRIMEGAV